MNTALSDDMAMAHRVAEVECPDDSVVLRFVHGELERKELETFDGHLDTCPHCRDGG